MELRNGGSQEAQHPDRMIRPCDDCKYCFYCSDEHFEAARHLHSEIPYEDGHDDLSQCQMNKEIFFDSWLVSRIHEDGIDRDAQGLLAFMHEPGPIQSVWRSVEGMTWENEYLPVRLAGSDNREPMEDNPISRAIFRRDTDLLTVSMTAVFALERFNAGDIAWTKKEVMTIHVGVLILWLNSAFMSPSAADRC
jgi:splicing suppressor protein 51